MSAPIIPRAAGSEPWKDEISTPAFRFPWRLVMTFAFIFLGCAVFALVAYLALSPDPYALPPEAVADGAILLSVSASATMTPTPSATVTPTASGAATERPAAVVDLGATFTLTPTTPGESSIEPQVRYETVYRDRQVVITSPPQIIYRDVVHEVVITSPPQIVYLVVTATPTLEGMMPTMTASPTPTSIPTLNPEATDELIAVTLEVACGHVICIPTAVGETVPEGFRR